MTAPTLVDPRQEFLNRPSALVDPNALSPETWAKMPIPNGRQYETLTDVMVGVGAAFYILARIMGNRLTTYRGRDLVVQLGGDALRFSVVNMTGTYRTAWKQMVNPAIMAAFKLGTPHGLSYDDEVAYASTFSNQIFDYVNETSSDALVMAYQSQLAQKWDPDLAWLRAINGYGLEQRSMSQYVKMLTSGEGRDILPTAARDFVQRALNERAQRIGLNEAYRAKELGKTVVWMNQFQRGELPVDTMRRWLTAEDEKVCVICGPMDRVAVKITDRFELPDGNKVWAPGVHPNCRCQVELTYPELVKRYDPHEPRDQRGRWAEVQERTEAPVAAPTAAPVTAPTVAPTVAPVAVTAPTVASVAAPTVAPVAAPKVGVTSDIKTVAPVAAPVKQKQDLSVSFFRPKTPLYAFANDFHYQAGDPHAWDNEPDYDVGDPVDLDKLAQPTGKGQSRFGLILKPQPGNLLLAHIASDKYGDSSVFDNYERTEKDTYHFVAQAFYDRAKKNAALIVPQLTYNDTIAIYKMAGDHISHRLMGLADLQEKLVQSVEHDGHLQHAYFHYLEHHAAEKVPGGTDLLDYNEDLPKEPHVPQVFVFERGVYGDYVADVHGGVEVISRGRYKVAKTQIIPGKPDMGTDLPMNIGALKLVYLEPAGDQFPRRS